MICFRLCCMFMFFFFKQKTAYEMRISDWSSDVCSSDLVCQLGIQRSGTGFIRHDPLTAVWQASRETFSIVDQTFTALGQIIRGDRGADELGGPIRIADMRPESRLVGKACDRTCKSRW